MGTGYVTTYLEEYLSYGVDGHISQKAWYSWLRKGVWKCFIFSNLEFFLSGLQDN